VRLSTLLDRPLPKNTWLQVGAIWSLAALPFAPLQIVPSEAAAMWRWTLIALAVGLSLYAVLNRVVFASLLAAETISATRAKWVGDRTHRPPEKLSALLSKSLQGFVELSLTVVVVGATIILSAAAVTYSLTHQLETSPFGAPPGSGVGGGLSRPANRASIAASASAVGTRYWLRAVMPLR